MSLVEKTKIRKKSPQGQKTELVTNQQQTKQGIGKNDSRQKVEH